jgi:hypothetical protein
MVPIGLGFRAMRGGAVVVGVSAEPRVVLNSFLPTAAEGDRLAYEPYHVAAEMADGCGVTPQIEAAVAEGRRRQAEMAEAGLADMSARLGRPPALAALLVNRAGWVTDLLSYSLAFADHPPVAEGLAVRDALRSAFAAQGLKSVEMDEKSLPDDAMIKLGLSPADIDTQMRALAAEAGRPWGKEQKMACLAAWTAVARA